MRWLVLSCFISPSINQIDLKSPPYVQKGPGGGKEHQSTNCPP